MITWLWWHRVEITAVTLPAAGAATVSPWWLAVSGVAGAWWGWQESRHRPPAPPPGDAGDKTDEARDEQREMA